MKKFICTLLCLCLCLFVADRGMGLLMNIVVNHSKDVLAPKLCYLRDSIHEDVVFIGASRCHHHYIPSIISDSIGMEVYNAGVGGSENIYSHYIVLQHILSRYTPKVICLEVMPTDYCQQEDAFNVISFFAPLFGRNEAADSVYRLTNKYKLYNISHLYRYNAKAPSNIIGLVMNRQAKNEQGYMPLPRPNTSLSKQRTEQTETTIDFTKMDYLHRFIRICKQKDIHLIFVVSPKYTIIDSKHYAVLKKTASDNEIPFLDYHSCRLYHDHPEYFKDETHLWDKGARLYSSVFAGDLKRLLQNPN